MKNFLKIKFLLLLLILFATGAFFLLAFFKNISTPSSAPFDAPKKDRRQQINYETPPPDFEAVLIWGQALTKTKDDGSPAKIIVDYIKILEQFPGEDPQVILEENYNQGNGFPLDAKMGGLYSRAPVWFEDDSHLPLLNSQIKDGMLEIDVAQTPDQNIHWWTQRVPTKTGARYLVEAKVKIIGNASLQFGSDYWRDLESVHNGFDKTCQSSNHCEAWSSNWHSDTKGEFIVIQAPYFDR